MIQVNEQNIHQVIAGFEMRIKSVEDRANVFSRAANYVTEGMIEDAALLILQYYAGQTNEELTALQKQIEELRDIQLRMRSNIIVPGGPLNSVIQK